MAGDWIKMRGGLFSSPKLIAMSRVLRSNAFFREWLTPGGLADGEVVSDHALRCVTGALLCVTWSWSREFGKALPNGDCLLPHISISDLDGIAGAPAVGEAMQTVGWAQDAPEGDGVILPKFFIDHNVPLTPAEKQRAYRERKKEAERVTETLPSDGNKTVTREEKRREEKNIASTNVDACSEPAEPASKPSSPAVVLFDVCGKTKTWPLTEAALADYQSAFPHLDVGGEARKAALWCRNNPERRKTAKGMARFLQSWLERAQNGRRPDSTPSPEYRLPELTEDDVADIGRLVR